jgi:ABC-type protease/lipase transport system fused ATPase/permease subunit
MRLPMPMGHVSLEQVTLRAPDGSVLLGNISFELRPGESLAIVGPSAAGKSLLCKMLAGIIQPHYGAVRIDGAELHTWHPEDLRPHVGYLPQEIALFNGTVGENIARLDNVEPSEIVRAATLAGVHELILRLPNGYQTDVGEFGHLLSGGQRQRIALARAMLGAPKLVILDEPNSNLDPAGEAALFNAIDELKSQGCTVVIVSHKLGLVRKLDKTLLLRDGGVQAIGPSGEVLSILMAENRVPLTAAAAQSNSHVLTSAR